MIIVYESKTGFTKKYAEMLSDKTALKVYHVKELSQININEEIIFLGWMKIGKVQGLKKVRKYNLKAVCGSGTGRTAEPDTKTIITRNKLGNVTFFYLRGGCFLLRDLKVIDRMMMSMFVKTLKKRSDKDEKLIEAIDTIENGFDGVKEENLIPIAEWLYSRQDNVL